MSKLFWNTLFKVKIGFLGKLVSILIFSPSSTQTYLSYKQNQNVLFYPWYKDILEKEKVI